MLMMRMTRSAGQEIQQERPLQTSCLRGIFRVFGYVVDRSHFAGSSRHRVPAAGFGRSDAASAQRGARSRFWRCRHREHLWRTDHACFGEVYRLVGSGILCDHPRAGDRVFASRERSNTGATGTAQYSGPCGHFANGCTCRHTDACNHRSACDTSAFPGRHGALANTSTDSDR